MRSLIQRKYTLISSDSLQNRIKQMLENIAKITGDTDLNFTTSVTPEINHENHKEKFKVLKLTFS